MSAFNPEIAARALMPKELAEQSGALHLSVHLHPAFVEVSLSEAAGGDMQWSQVFHLEQAGYRLGEALRFLTERNWHEKVYRSCTVSFDTSAFCLVPAAFFDPAESSELLAFQTTWTDGETGNIEIPEIGAVMIFGMPQWKENLLSLYPNARIMPVAFPELKFAFNNASATSDSLSLFVTPGLLLLCAFQKKKLVLINAFEIAGEEDVLYHLSNAAMRLGIDQENADIHLCEFAREEGLTNLLRHYCRSVNHHFNAGLADEAGFLSNLHVLCV